MKTLNAIRRAYRQALGSVTAAMILILLCGLGSPAAYGQARKWEKSFGPKIGYVGRNHSVEGGLVFRIALAEHVRLAPEATIFFRNKNKDALSLACNVQFPFAVQGSPVSVYPFAGVEYLSWGLHGIDSATNDDVTSHVNRLGGNAGAGIEVRCTESLLLSLEGRYTLVRTYPTAQVSVGISYVF